MRVFKNRFNFFFQTNRQFIFFRGQLLIEILIAIGLSALFIPVLMLAIISSRDGKVRERQQTTAVALLKETEEAIRSVKNSGWSNLPSNGTYYPAVSGSNWTLIAGSSTSAGFTRQAVFSNPLRATSSGEIVSTDGYKDTSTLRIDITISWTTPLNSTLNSTLYLTRNKNLSFVETSVADFNAGDLTNTIVSSASAGEVVLADSGIGHGNWCDPDLSISTLDLPKSGVANAISAIEGTAFAGTGDNASGVSFAKINISNNNPPVSSISGTFSNYKTNDVFGENNYGYIATDTNSSEVVILNTASIPYTQVGYFDASGNTDATSVFVVGNTGYMVQGNKFRNFDLSSKTGSRPAIDSDGITLPGNGSKMMVIGNYAYIALTTSSKELQIVDLSNPSSLSLAGYVEVDPLDLNSGDVATDVYVNPSGTRAYLVIESAANLPEFYIIDISTKTGSRSIVGSYETNSMSPQAVTVVTNNKAIIVGISGEEYQVIDIANETTPSLCGGLNIDSGIKGIDSVLEADGDAYSYIITGNASSEFQIILGGAGGGGGNYVDNGTFESTPFDSVSAAAFNRFTATVASPSAATIKMQVGVAAPTSGSCGLASYSYVGPDGDPSSYFFPSGNSISANIPLGNYSSSYVNPERCFRYKVFLTTSDQTQTPVFYDIKVNYSN